MDSVQDTNYSYDLPDSLSTTRVEIALMLRDSVSERVWDSFNDKRNEGPFIYFNGDISEIFFPDSIILSRIDNYEVYSDDYIRSVRTDSIPYHFELMISFDEADSNKFYYSNPVQQFLSVEETSLFIPPIQSTEWWLTMVLHEMFHQHQFSQPTFLDYSKYISNLGFDTRNLARLIQEDENYQSLIMMENELLINAIEENDVLAKKAFIKEYLKKREQRIIEYSSDYPFLEEVESFYVFTEGSARYIEYHGMKVLEHFTHDSSNSFKISDPRFQNFREFNNVNLTGNEFNYLTYAGGREYHYALGFNTMRLLDSMNIEYKNNVFTNPEIGLHRYLE